MPAGLRIQKNNEVVVDEWEQRMEQVRRRHAEWKKEGRIPQDTPPPTAESIERPNETIPDEVKQKLNDKFKDKPLPDV